MFCLDCGWKYGKNGKRVNMWFNVTRIQKLIDMKIFNMNFRQSSFKIIYVNFFVAIFIYIGVSSSTKQKRELLHNLNFIVRVKAT